MPLPALSQIGGVFMKLETVAGTAEPPLVPGDFILASDVQYNPDVQLITRNYMRPSLSALPHIIGRRLAQITFSVEVLGTGVAATTTTPLTQAAATPKWADLLEACGMVGAAVATPAGKVYSPTTQNMKTATIDVYLNDVKHRITGAMGTFTITANAGQIATINFTFTGVHQAPIVAATPPIPAQTINPPIVENAGIAIGATTGLIIEQVSLDIGNSVIERPDANSPSGFLAMHITGRAAKMTLNPEVAPEATHPFWSDFIGGVSKTFTATVGTVDGNKMIISAPQVQPEQVSYGDRNGLRVYDVNYNVMTSSANGNDEFTIRFQ